MHEMRYDVVFNVYDLHRHMMNPNNVQIMHTRDPRMANKIVHTNDHRIIQYVYDEPVTVTSPQQISPYPSHPTSYTSTHRVHNTYNHHPCHPCAYHSTQQSDKSASIEKSLNI